MKLWCFVFILATGTGIAQDSKSYTYTLPGSAVSFTMVAVPGGKFTIGSSSALKEQDEIPQKVIELSAFWIGEKEVTFAEWDVFFKNQEIPQGKKIDGITRPTTPYIDLTKGMGRQPQQPVNSMSQVAAIMYCKWLYTTTGNFYRLPTEAEWEYACKAGAKTDNPAGHDPARLDEHSININTSGGRYHAVGSKKPNAWGLYDMLGNLAEWTIDQYIPDYYTTIAGRDPMTTPGSRYPRTVRGGSFMDEAAELRCTNRIPSDPEWNKNDPQIPKSQWWLTDGGFVGFRIVRPVKQPSAEEIEQFYNRYLKN
jgi:formylglycine-generating enzyme required for sulfatase activity